MLRQRCADNRRELFHCHYARQRFDREPTWLGLAHPVQIVFVRLAVTLKFDLDAERVRNCAWRAPRKTAIGTCPGDPVACGVGGSVRS